MVRMATDFGALGKGPRLLMEAKLRPVQGNRFQPTGFADLGAARYTLHDGTEMLLVESAQSVANRMELACCKDDGRTMLDELSGLPYIVGKHKDEIFTTSYLEAHRLSSPYLLNDEWAKKLAGEMQLRDDYQINNKTAIKTLFKYDPSCLARSLAWNQRIQRRIFWRPCSRHARTVGIYRGEKHSRCRKRWNEV